VRIDGEIAGHKFVDGWCARCGKTWRSISHVTTDDMPADNPEELRRWSNGWACKDPGTSNEARQIMVKRAEERAHWSRVMWT
jgi:hypothetical protein